MLMFAVFKNLLHACWVFSVMPGSVRPLDCSLPDSYWTMLPCPPLGDLPDPGIKPMSLMCPALAGRFLPLPGKLFNPLESLNLYRTSSRPWKLLNWEELGLNTSSARCWHRDTAQCTCVLQSQFPNGRCTHSYSLHLFPQTADWSCLLPARHFI